MLDGSLLEIARWGTAIAVFGLAGYSDLQYRQVDRRVWLPAIAVGLITWYIDPPTLSNAVLSVVLVAIVALTYRVRDLGLGDVFAVGSLALLLPHGPGAPLSMWVVVSGTVASLGHVFYRTVIEGRPVEAVLEAEQPYVLSLFFGVWVTAVTLRFAI